MHFFQLFPNINIVLQISTDMIFALGALMEEHRDSQKGLHCVFVALEKAYDRVLREAVVLFEELRLSHCNL